jgi:hypothetical protein
MLPLARLDRRYTKLVFAMRSHLCKRCLIFIIADVRAYEEAGRDKA